MGSVPSKRFWSNSNRVTDRSSVEEEELNSRNVIAFFAKRIRKLDFGTLCSGRAERQLKWSESWSQNEDALNKFRSLPEVFALVESNRDVDSVDMIALLEHLDQLNTIRSDHPSDLREKWVEELCSLGWIRVWRELWVLFWSEAFLDKRLSEFPVRRLNFAYALRISWTCSELSEGFSRDFVSNDCFARVLAQLSRLTQSSDRASVRYFISGLMSVLCNCLRHGFQKAKGIFRNVGGVDLFVPFLKSKYPNLRVKAVIALAYVVTEEEPQILKSVESGIEEVLRTLEKCLDSEEHHFHGFGSQELLDCLNKFAVPDANKILIFQKNGLRIFVRSMKEGLTEREISTAAKCLWMLSFVDENRIHIEQEREVMELLERLKFHRNSSIADAAKGTLWLISLAFVKFVRKISSSGALAKDSADKLWPIPKNNRKRSTDVGTSTFMGEGHIMLSYSWDYKEIVKVINEGLIQSGFTTWIDDVSMTGSILDSMAQAIENASLVMVFLSESYKESPSCRTEAEYAFRLRKPILPIRNQDKFVADGWCGALIGNQLYFNCASVAEAHEMLPKIITEIQRKLSGHSALPKISIDTVSADQSHLEWSEEDVQDWLRSKLDLSERSVEKFKDFTGKELDSLKTMFSTAPNVFYSVLIEKYQLELPEVLRLSNSLQTL